MKLCTFCRTPLTEFDLNFNKRVFPNQDTSLCKCFRCSTKGPVLEAFEKAEKKKSVLPYGLTFLFIIVFELICAGILFILNIRGLFYHIPVTIAAGSYFIFAYLIVKNMGVIKTYETYTPERTWYEGTLDSDSNTVELEKHHTSASYGTSATTGSMILAVLLYFTMHVWLIPYMIYVSAGLRSSLYKKCPRNVVDAYYEAKAESPKFVAKGKEVIALQNYLQEKKKYDQETAQIQSKYQMFGENTTKTEISNLYFPMWRVTIDEQVYSAVSLEIKKGIPVYPLFLVGKNANGKYVGRAVYSIMGYNYLTPVESLDDFETWADDTHKPRLKELLLQHKNHI